MSDDLELARRAVACRAWRWRDCCPVVAVDAAGAVMPGLGQVVGMTSFGSVRVHWPYLGRGDTQLHESTDLLPDLTDPAGLGCLLALVREVHGAASVVVYLPRDGAIRAWRVVTFASGADWLTLGEGSTETEALVVALENTE
jgi:hypothetical protein